MSAAPTTQWQARRAARDTQHTIIGGVASGLARHLAVPVVWVRAAFVLAALLGGMGVAFYAGLWLVLPSDTRFAQEAPGLESATRGGRRPGPVRSLRDAGPAIALGVLGVGLILLVEAFVGQGTLFWPAVIGLAGMALLWRQADEAQRERWLDQSGRINPVRAVFGAGGWASWLRVGAGLGLIVVAIVTFALRGGKPSDLGAVTGSAIIVVAGLALTIGPWVYRLASDLSAERAERVRSQERADVAAHLHDSVLQTLALIQKNAGDAPMVARLARAQERDLRAWLFDDQPGEAASLVAALRAVAADVEDAHGIAVDVVTVGDVPAGEQMRPLVSAAREAMTNAAKHAGTGRVDVYAEVSPAAVDVFVRDRGIGFDPESVPADRHGLRHSVVDRMVRHGGSATIRSSPGAGTEVRLHLPTDEPQASRGGAA